MHGTARRLAAPIRRLTSRRLRIPPDHELYPASDAYGLMQPLRIPGGWLIAVNKLRLAMDDDLSQVGGATLFHAVNAARRFNIDVDLRPEFDVHGVFHLTVGYQPWPRSPKGRRIKHVPLHFDSDGRCMHAFETRSYPTLVRELEHWIARCTVWQVEPG